MILVFSTPDFSLLLYRGTPPITPPPPPPTPHPQGTQGAPGAMGTFGVVPQPFRMASHFEWMAFTTQGLNKNLTYDGLLNTDSTEGVEGI